MTDNLFFLILTSINTSYVSVLNTPYVSTYHFYTSKKDGTTSFIELSSSYSHTSLNNIYALYTLYIDDELICSATQQVLPSKENPHKKLKLTNAEKLEALLKACSAKILQQELKSHQMHMLKTFVNDIQQKSN